MPVAKKERTGHKCLGQRKKDQTTNDGGKRKMADGWGLGEGGEGSGVNDRIPWKVPDQWPWGSTFDI